MKSQWKFLYYANHSKMLPFFDCENALSVECLFKIISFAQVKRSLQFTILPLMGCPLLCNEKSLNMTSFWRNHKSILQNCIKYFMFINGSFFKEVISFIKPSILGGLQYTHNITVFYSCYSYYSYYNYNITVFC